MPSALPCCGAKIESYYIHDGTGFDSSASASASPQEDRIEYGRQIRQIRQDRQDR